MWHLFWFKKSSSLTFTVSTFTFIVDADTCSTKERTSTKSSCSPRDTSASESSRCKTTSTYSTACHKNCITRNIDKFSDNSMNSSRWIPNAFAASGRDNCKSWSSCATTTRKGEAYRTPSRVFATSSTRRATSPSVTRSTCLRWPRPISLPILSTRRWQERKSASVPFLPPLEMLGRG